MVSLLNVTVIYFPLFDTFLIIIICLIDPTNTTFHKCERLGSRLVLFLPIRAGRSGCARWRLVGTDLLVAVVGCDVQGGEEDSVLDVDVSSMLQ